MPRVRWLVVGMVAGCLVAGCGGDDGDQEVAATTVATTGASTGSQATTATAFPARYATRLSVEVVVAYPLRCVAR